MRTAATIILLILCLTIVGTAIIKDKFIADDEDIMDEGLYYGPVPEGYDQEHFWKTGEMKKIGDGDGSS